MENNSLLKVKVLHKLFRMAVPVLVIVSAVIFPGCSVTRNPGLSIHGGDPVLYRCETGDTITARYYTLSDVSLRFVKLTMPDGRVLTLPNVVSASGARYTDDREIVWWIKGNTAFVQIRDENGEWRMLYRDCKVVRQE